MRKNNKWGIGAIIWFCLMIAAEWLMCIEYATKPAMQYNTAYQKAAVIYGIIGLVGTLLYLWLLIGKKKLALIIILAIAGISIIRMLFQGSFIIALVAAIKAAITFLIARKEVGFGEQVHHEPEPE